MGYEVFPQPSAAAEPNSFSIVLGTTYAGNADTGNVLNGVAGFNATTTLKQGYYEIADGAGYIGSTGYARTSTAVYSYAIVYTDGTVFGVTTQSSWEIGGQSPGGEYTAGLVYKIRQIGDVVWAGFNRYDFIGSLPLSGGSIRVSTDAGASWTSIVLTTDSRAATDIWHDGTRVWAHDTQGHVYNSTNSLNFNVITTNQNNWRWAMYDTSTGYHIAADWSNQNFVMLSTNGINWSSRALSTGHVTYDIKRANNFLFTIGATASAFISTDALNWTRLTTGTNSWGFATSGIITDVEFKSPWYIACSSRREIFISTNITNWQQAIYETGLGGSGLWTMKNDGNAVLAFGGYAQSSTTLGGYLISSNGNGWGTIGAGLLTPNDGTQKYTDKICVFSTAINGYKYVAITYPSQIQFPPDNGTSQRSLNGDTLMRTNAFSGVLQLMKNFMIKKFNLTSKLL